MKILKLSLFLLPIFFLSFENVNENMLESGTDNCEETVTTESSCTMTVDVDLTCFPSLPQVTFTFEPEIGRPVELQIGINTIEVNELSDYIIINSSYPDTPLPPNFICSTPTVSWSGCGSIGTSQNFPIYIEL
ncbi:MAG: hypothetical protein AAFZ15_11305 [Bacteroidota bacterium]